MQNFLTNIKKISKITDSVGLSMLYPAPEVWLSVEIRGQSTCLDQIIKWKQCCFAFFLENKSCFQRVMASAHHSTHKSKEASFQVVVQCQTLCPQSSPSKQNKPKQHAASTCSLPGGMRQIISSHVKKSKAILIPSMTYWETEGILRAGTFYHCSLPMVFFCFLQNNQFLWLLMQYSFDILFKDCFCFFCSP